MSRKRADPHQSRAAQRRAEAAREGARRTREPEVGAPANRAPIVAIGTALVVIVLIVGWWVFVAVPGGTRPGIVGPSPSPSTATGASGPSPSALVGGGPLAQKVVAALHADPFRAHIDETTVARSTKGGVAVTLTAKAVGDVSGKDVALHVTSTGAGPAVDQDTVSVGTTTWIRRTGSTTWEVHQRSEAASAIDGLLQTLRVIDDPAELGDAGPDTVDGQPVRHLTAIGPVAYRSPDGVDSAYDVLDIWATDAGVPVLVRGSFSDSQGTTSLIGSVTIRYSDVGKPVTIAPPRGAPSPIP